MSKPPRVGKEGAWFNVIAVIALALLWNITRPGPLYCVKTNTALSTSTASDFRKQSL